eukprot:CAMPEP_0113844820 /NCGR_PEP_ID=MMETSP0372-20130328/433_1 /TAXON_ID=340204 /ORGANISM="Lankesteria abbotti" /LENGTH=365 /DNA_ID=CAMNT_0000813833 /DNA_START=25 /DNA_END=1122 /DNA_ORIENTATION=+ /assembly_acc=CAM_ASM_000359
MTGERASNTRDRFGGSSVVVKYFNAGVPVAPVEVKQIREVWADNLEEEMQRISDLVCEYPYIAIDTEFPGIVARPTGTGKVVTDYSYLTVKCNVDLLKLIQLGFTFANAKGHVPPDVSTVQFNFFFNLEDDIHAQDSIEFLRQSGVDFEKHQRKGIDLFQLGELLMGSGLVMTDRVKWISFHGCYDFGYLLKLLTCKPLPHSEGEFFDLLNTFFPALYDIKVLLRRTQIPQFNSGSSLAKVAEYFQLERIGSQHQAGSDSLLTCHAFFTLLRRCFNNKLNDTVFAGVIYGLSPPRLTSLHGSPAGVLLSPRVTARLMANGTSSNNTSDNIARLPQTSQSLSRTSQMPDNLPSLSSGITFDSKGID